MMDLREAGPSREEVNNERRKEGGKDRRGKEKGGVEEEGRIEEQQEKNEEEGRVEEENYLSIILRSALPAAFPLIGFSPHYGHCTGDSGVCTCVRACVGV